MKNPEDIPTILIDIEEAPDPRYQAKMAVGVDAEGRQWWMDPAPVDRDTAIAMMRDAIDTARTRASSRGRGGKSNGIAAMLTELVRQGRDPRILFTVDQEHYLRNVTWPTQQPRKDDLIDRIDQVVAEAEALVTGIRFERWRQHNLDELRRMFGDQR